MLRKLLFNSKYWNPYKISTIDYCMFSCAGHQFISYDIEDYPFIFRKGVSDCLLVYSLN